MTRINLIDPKALTDQHLFAEYREITRIFALVAQSVDKYGTANTLKKIPKSYRLGTGHVLFFYDKLAFIEKRYEALRDELLDRKVNITLKDSISEYRQFIPHIFYQDYHPTTDEQKLSVERIIQKITAKPNWYKWRGVLIDDGAYIPVSYTHLTLPTSDLV